MDEQTKTELKELAATKLFAIRIADQAKYVIDPYFELTNLPLALIDLTAIPKELKKSFDLMLDIELTVQQARVALLIASGFSYDYIAEILKIEKTSVTNHKTDVFAKIVKLHENHKNLSRFDTRSLLILLVQRLLNQSK